MINLQLTTGDLTIQTELMYRKAEYVAQCENITLLFIT